MQRGQIRLASARGVALALAAAVGAVAGCQLVLDFSPVPDGGGEDDGGLVAACELGEPNDELSAAAAASPGSAIQGALCGADDRDFFSFAVDGAQDAIVELTFGAADGDLELELWSVGTGEVLTVSTGTDDDERIEHSAALGNLLPAGEYAALVVGRDGAVENDYELLVTLGGGMPDAGPVPDAAMR